MNLDMCRTGAPIQAHRRIAEGESDFAEAVPGKRYTEEERRVRSLVEVEEVEAGPFEGIVEEESRGATSSIAQGEKQENRERATNVGGI